MPQTLWAEISQHISAATGEHFEARQPQAIGGGCINTAYLLDNGAQRYFVKTNAAHFASMLAAESAGLEAIGATNSVRAPRAICHGVVADHSYLVLEYIDLRGSTGRTARTMGEQLAAMHFASADRFGFSIDNAIGATPQINTWCDDWVQFYSEHRLRHQLKLATQNGLKLGDQGERLIENLPAFFKSYQPRPALLHGDLWGGNWGSDEYGAPVIFDPATYYGDREADLAMTELFGGFPSAFYDAYRAAAPLDAGYDIRKTLYNLYHILNHYNLFGGGYGGQAQQMLRRLNAEIS